MSNTIDQRVVEMRFDNKQFESGVSTTMSTLDKLKQKLNLTGASKGLDGLNAAAKKVNMTGLGGAVDTVSAKFSALQVMGVTALANITNSAVNAGKRIVKSLTVDPIMSGFSEYETKMGSIQTILANTEHQGTTMDQVTAALDELNHYADKTIYNFQEMTRNIGTFTAAGVDLDTSVRSIQGIANLAAVSGSTSQQASTAMYQLSQALATGTVKLMDWNSVVNAGMGGKVFQNALIQTAAMLDGAAANVEEWQAKNIDAYGSFRDSLTQGEWLTSEVLTKTLEQFTMAAETGSKEWEAFKQSLMDDGYTEVQAESILKMANTATDAATKVKTFTQLMDTLKESAQSGWAQTWETIIGDFEEAKEFFTGLSDMFGGIIGDSAERRNNLLEGALGSSWEKLTNKISDAGVEAETFDKAIEKIVGKSKLDKLVEEFGSIEKAAKAGKISSDDLKKAIASIGGEAEKSLNFGDLAEKVKGNKFLYSMGGLGRVSDEVKRIQEALNSLGYDISPDGKFGKATYQAVMAFQRAEGIKIDGIVGEETIAALEKATGKTGELTGNIDGLSESCEGLIDDLTKPSGRELLLDSLMNVIKAIHRPLAAVGEALRNTFSISPEQLYNALEAVNNFTSKFVPKGILDETTWDGLIKKVEKFGVTESKLTTKLGATLEKNGIDIKALQKEYGSLGKAFDAGAISIDHVKDALLSFEGISESMLLGGETTDKLRRAFEGLFAVLKVIGAFAGGGLKFAFNVLTTILGAFDMSVLDLAANMGDALVSFQKWIFEGNLIAQMFDKLLERLPDVVKRFKDWFGAFKETPAVQKLVSAIEAIESAFSKLMSGETNISEFATSLGTNLANALKSLPEIAMQIAGDFIKGFTDGLGSSITGVISNIVSFCMDFVAAFAAALGVQSPSWKAYDIAVDFFQGFINGCKAIFNTVKDVLGNVGETMVKIFKDLWDSITDESGNIQWGKIVAAGIITSVLWILKTFATAFGGIAEAFDGLGDIFENIGRSIKSFSKVLNAHAWDLKAQALQKLAIAIAILVASIWVLAQIDDPSKLGRAIVTIGALAGILIGMAWAMDKMSQASVSINKNGASIDGLKTGLMQIGIVLMLLALTVKMIGTMDADAAKQGFIGLAGMAGGLLLFVAAMAGISIYAKDVGKIGSMMIKLAFAMLLLVGVVKMVDGLSSEEMGKGVIFAAMFALFVAAITRIAKSSGNNVGKVGSMLIKLTIAMALMVGVVKMASKLSLGEMTKGALFVAGFTTFVWALTNVTKIGKKQQIAKLGGLILSISFSLTLMVGVCKLVGKLSVGEMIKGAAFVAGFAFLLKAVVGILSIGSDQQLAKVASTILAFSFAIGILAGVSALLGLVDTASLTKGIIAVGMLSAMMALMTKSLKGAQNAKGAIMMMAVCIGIMAAAVVGLSFIPFEDLAPAVAGLSIVMATFALMLNGLSKLKVVKIGPLIAMTGVVVVLAGILAILSHIKVGSTIEIAASISLLMVTLGVTMQLIAKTGASATAAIGPVAALAVVAGLIGLVLVGLSKLNPGPTIEIATAISEVLLAMSASALILSKIGPMATAGIGGAAAFLGLVVGAGAILAALGGIVAMIPGAQEFLDSGIPIIESVGKALGSLVGGIIEGIGEGVGDTLIQMGEDIATFMDALRVASDNAAGIDGNAFDGVGKLIGVLAGIGLTSVGTTISDIFTSLFGGGTSMEKFQTDAIAFFEAMKAISEASTGITMNEEGLDNVISTAEKLAELQSSLNPIGGVVSWFTGRDDLGSFGVNIGAFIESMKTALSSLKGFVANTAALDPIISAAKSLSDLQSSLEPIGGVVSWFTGRDDLGSFGINVGAFIESMKTALSNLSGFVPNTTAIDPIISAAKSLADLQESLTPIGGVISWFTGRDDLATFGVNISTFISSMKTALSTLDGITLNEDALTSVITAAKNLSKLQESLEPMGGVIDWFAGRDDLGSFGTNISTFAAAMGMLKAEMGEDGISEGVITSVTNAGNAIIALQDALPEEGWFDGKMDLDTFAGYITDFATAMGTFATETSEMDPASIDTAISCAYRIRTLIQSLTGLDASGLASFAGVGLGDGHLVNMGQAIAKYGEAVADLNVEAVSTSVSAAVRIKDLIASLVGLDTSGIENFKIGSIGTAMKDYAANVAELDPGVVSSSVSAAYRLRDFIVGLAGIDTSGIVNFNPRPIGSAMNAYAGSVAGIDSGAIIASIFAANNVKNFISNLAGMDSSGVATFKLAISQLSTVDLAGLVSAFAGKASELGTAARSIIDAMVNGLTGGGDRVVTAMQTIADGVKNAADSKVGEFTKIGTTFVTNLVSAIISKVGTAKSAGTTLGNSAASGARGAYSNMYTSGGYIAQGLVNGMYVWKTSVWYKGYELGRAAAQGVDKGAGNASPSKKTTQSGIWIGQGLVNGVDSMGRSVAKAGYAMGETAVDSISRAISHISDVINSDIDAQPTIRPVLDLSDVRAGASSIGDMLGSNPVSLMTNVGAVSTMMNRRGQNGAESEVVSAITKLRRDLANMPRESYNINGVTYDDGSNIKSFAQAVVHQARIERRV